MDTNERREPTDAELLTALCGMFNAAKRLAANRSLYDVETMIDAANATPWEAKELISGTRPMPDTHAPGEERRTVCVYDKLDPDYVFRPDDAGEYSMQVDRRSGTRRAPMPDTEAPQPAQGDGEGGK